MVLVRNPNYWQKGADGQALPYVDKVIVTAGWDDASRLAALIGDQADILAPRQGIVTELQRYPGRIDVQTYITGWVTPIVMRVDMPPFDDVRVRNALKLVQDRERIRSLVMPMGPVGPDHMIPSSDAAD
jgi:peptide/nickel transport system substrate-binding protein